MKLLLILLLSSTLYADTITLGPRTNAIQLRGRNISATAPTSGQVLTWNSTTSKWTPAAASGTGFDTIGAFGSTPDAKGATSSGTTITFQPADATHPGMVAAGAQTFAGPLTVSSFIGALTGNASTATALAANGTNCSAGQYPLGVDASGNSESCAVITSLGAIATGVWNGTVITVPYGGTGQSTLTNHGVLVGAAAAAITQLAAGSAGQVLQSGGASADPSYSTPTYPSTSGTSGKVLVSNGTNNVYSTPTFPNASATSGKIIVSDGTNWIASTPTYPNASATAGKIIRSDGTNFAASTATIPDTATTSDLLYASATNVWSSLAKTNTAALITNSSGVPAWVSGGTANRLLRTDGTTVSFAQAAISTDISGLGTNVATFLATPSSANLAAALTDETGSGVSVFGTSPTFTTNLTSPLVIGGTGTTSTLTLKTTSGVGTTGADMIFQVGNNGGTEAMRILNSGKTGLGVSGTSPAAQVHIGGGDGSGTYSNATLALGLGTSGQYPQFIHTRSNGAAGGNAIDFYTGDGTAAGVYPTNAVLGLSVANGSVGVGVSDPLSQLHTTGTVRFANFGAGACTFDASGNLSSASDESLKDIQRDFTDSLEQIKLIAPIVYKWKSLSGLDTENEYVGWSAQNLRSAVSGATYAKKIWIDSNGKKIRDQNADEISANEEDAITKSRSPNKLPEGAKKKDLLSVSDRAIIAAMVNSLKQIDARLRALEAGL